MLTQWIPYCSAELHLDPFHSDLVKNKFEKGLLLKTSKTEIYKGFRNYALTLSLSGEAIQERYSKVHTQRDIVNSIEGLLGNIEPSLARCLQLYEEEKILGTLKFLPQGLTDPTLGEGKPLFAWMNATREDFLPNYLEVPNGTMAEYVPTFQKLREACKYIPPFREQGPHSTFPGETFADCIETFLNIYDAVKEHKIWESEEKERSYEQGEENPIPKRARLVFPISE
jgi:hypothetical protein